MHLDRLPWKRVHDGLDEADGVEVVYEGGKVAFNVLHVDEPKPPAPRRARPPVPASFDPSLLPAWRPFNLHPHLLSVLHARAFSTPTPIQASALPPALAGRDVIGVAETGSGKTLAYGLPLLHRVLARPTATLQALVLAPTRELALQVSDHLNVFSRVAGALDKVQGKGSLPLLSVGVLVGGMSAQKQRRILDRGVDVLIATPGRLWDTLQEDAVLAQQIRHLDVLVLDEADRMIEAGHFAEMDHILRLTARPSSGDHNDGLQTFVFSATLSKDLQRNLKRRSRPKPTKKGTSKPSSTLDDLLLRLDFRDPEPQVIDLGPKGGVVATLQESKVECLASEKDAYLYYFLLRYPGRSLVFLSAIDGIRRLTPLLELLRLKVFPLHSQLEQRQRLKNLDRFKATPDGVLLATDIAARGLDIAAVDHVIHYQIPRSADVFVHRNGRTARAMRKGFSLLMCSPDERRVVRALLSSLGRQEADIPDLGIELTLLDHLQERIRLAKQVDAHQHRVKKRNHERSWLREAADAMEIELDSDVVSASEDDDDGRRQQRKRARTEAAAAKDALKELLSRPLIARGVSTRYVTSGSRPIADDLVAGRVHDAMVGLARTDAASDLVGVGRRHSVGTRCEQDPEEEEWTGIGT